MINGKIYFVKYIFEQIDNYVVIVGQGLGKICLNFGLIYMQMILCDGVKRLDIFGLNNLEYLVSWECRKEGVWLCLNLKSNQKRKEWDLEFEI